MSPARPPALRPMLAVASGVPADRSGWVAEPKWDGVRAIVTISTGTVRVASRNGNDVTAAYPELTRVPEALTERSMVLDGEIVALGPSGAPDFGRLQRRMHVRRPAAALVHDVPVNLVIFDALWVDGVHLVDRPYRERRAVLVGLGVDEAPWLTSPVLDLPPEDLLATCRELGLEGYVLKREDAPYVPGRRSAAWVKVKCVRRREFVVGGWMPGKAGQLGSLALGVHAHPGGPLEFVGLAGSGLSGADIAAFRNALEHLERAASPFAGVAPAGVRFLEPVLVAEVGFSEVTHAGTLRHPVLVGFRTDVDPLDVVRDDELRAP
ncbi:MAG: ATP-dependent DNA ligase [Acidimicrobiales bacterium]